MTKVTTPTATESAIRRVWKSAQIYIAFHKDQKKAQTRGAETLAAEEWQRITA